MPLLVDDAGLKAHAGATFFSDIILSTATLSLWVVPLEQWLQVLATAGAVVLVITRIYVAIEDARLTRAKRKTVDKERDE